MVKTPNFAFELPDFNKVPWNQLINDNWSIIDAVMSRFVAINNVKGVWPLATVVAVDDTYIDNIDGTLYRVLVAHTTASSGTFAADRTKTPANWILATTTVTDAGTWVAAKGYSANQFVTDASRFGITTASFTSDTTYNLDVTAGNIITLVDVSSVNLPTTIVALNYLRANAGATGYEARTVVQALADLGAQAADGTLNAIAGITVAANELIYATGADAFAATALTAAARTLLDDTTIANMRTTLGLVIGTDVQTEDANLTSIAALSPVAGQYLGYNTGGAEAVVRGVLGTTGYETNRYYAMQKLSEADTLVTTADRLYGNIFPVFERTTFTRLGIEVTASAGTNARVGIYNFDMSSLTASTLVVDGGTVLTSSNAEVEATISTTLMPGFYILAVVFDNTPTVIATDVAIAFSRALFGAAALGGTDEAFFYTAHTFAALPATFGSPTYVAVGASASPLVWVRKV